ncbi:FecR domain-containing protein [Patescibacteria group bacterium]|nr:FecR domain-containing protein [Patescibacteria group bacterium]MDL1952639.1 FecR domain-containing protein [Candidatus Uhrbacteria bacterium UHB]RIL01228.1 MAG: hypothetical protein DCC77_01675 [Candidatus Uhrbacteria bacterium]
MLRRFFAGMLAFSFLVLAGQGCFRSPAAGDITGSPGASTFEFAAEITNVQGAVILTRNGEEIGVDNHTRVQTGDRLDTKEGSSVTVEFYKGSRMALDENSSVVIAETSVDGSDWKKQVVRLQLIGGRVWSRTLKLLDIDSLYEVKYQNAIATVRGTAFLMTGVSERLKIDEYDGSILLQGAVSGILSEGFTTDFDTRNPPQDFPSVILPTTDDDRNEPFVRRQLKADAIFAEEASRIRRDAGIQEDVSRVGHEAGVFTLDEPSAVHSGFQRVEIEAVDPKTLDDGTVVMLDDSDQAFRAYAIFIDARGERRDDITARATWQLGNSDTGVLSPTGLFHSAAGYMGGVNIVARYNDGTHEHSGAVHVEVFTRIFIESILPDFSIF